ncbi:MAG: DUF2723 domain-containing protein [Elusimicrobia bacterium]|nr:DUF2723 domain-containing protein [Elusimicrobiota bacterium]
MPNEPVDPRRDQEIAGALGAALLALYWILRGRSFGPGDSPQHVLSALTWGVSVAPGYPLYVMLGKLASLLPLGTPASNVNGLSGIFHAAAAAGFFVLLRQQGLKRLPALLAAVLMALSRLYWYYSEIAEVRALNDFLAIGAALWAARWARRRTPAFLLILACLLGLGIGHHPTFILVIPAIAYRLWSKRAWPRGFGWLILLGGALLSCAAPYLILYYRLQAGSPAWNPAETKTLSQVWDLFTRKSVGGPLRMVVGSGVFGFGTFDGGRFLQHLAWFVAGCLSDVGPALILSAAGAWRLWKKDRETFLFWGLWVFFSAFVFISISSQQLILCDADYVRGMVMRFYLLPYIGLFALAGFGAGWLLEQVRPAFGWALLAAAVAVPLCVRPISLRHHDLLMDYCRLVVKSTGPSDMIILAPDDTILGLSYLELAEGTTEDRVLLIPSLFSYLPYIGRLQRRHPTLGLPPLEGRSLTTDWRGWLKANPKRRLFAEAVLRDTVLNVMPQSAPSGVLGELRLARPKRGEVGRSARAFLESTPEDFITRWGIEDFTQEVYLLRTYRMLLEWYGSSLEKTDALTALRIKARLEAL